MRISEQNLLDEIHRLSNDIVGPTKKEMASQGKYSPDTYVSRWGSWKKAVRKAGFVPTRGATKQELLKEIHRLSENGSPPTSRDMLKEGIYSVPTYIDRFGSWNNAIEAANHDPHLERNIPETRLLAALKEAAEESSGTEIFEESTYRRMTYADHFHSYWSALVKADIPPIHRRPLSPVAIDKFHRAAINETKTKHRLLSLLHQFTGLTGELIEELSPPWIANLGNEYAVKVPAEHLQTDEPWSFKIPDTWTNPTTGEEEKTGLPQLLDWFVRQDNTDKLTIGSARHSTRKVAIQANLSPHREMKNYQSLNTSVPLVRAEDLRATLGIQMARNGAPTEVIRQHLGIKHTGWPADVQEFFIWLDHHEPQFEHPDYNP